jgi:MFS family permease
MGRLADALGSRPAFMMSYAVTSFAMIWGLFTHNLWGLYVFAVFFGFGWGAQAVLRIVVTSEIFGLVSIGLLIAVLGLPEAAAGALGSYYAGYLFDILADYAPAFWIGIAISTMGIILARLLKPIARG